MSPIVWIIVVIVVLLVIAGIIYGVQASRRKQLQNTFGPEYDRVVSDTGSRSDGEKELREREKRHAELELKPLSAESKATYSTAWEEVQIDFVDNPEQAVTTADDLVTRLITERGYPTAEYDDQLANLSVDHARTLGHYRDAHTISERSKNGEASTEDLRQALVHYRALFSDLLGTDPLRTSPNATATAVAGSNATEPDAAPSHVNNSDVADSRPDVTRS
jgi:ribosomal protein L13E